MSDYLDPATLNAERLYKLQSITWSQGAKHERERIINLITDSKVINTDQKYFLLAEIKEEQSE
jgi:hypothetical protein